MHQPDKLNLSNETVAQPVKGPVNASDLDAEATAALEEARNMPPGPARTEALKKAGLLRKAADLQLLSFARRGRPPK